MGAETRDRFRRLLLGQGYQVEKSWYIPTGWWKTAHKLDTLRLDARRLLLVGIPHLSRFRVISGQKYTTSTNELLDTIARRLNT